MGKSVEREMDEIALKCNPDPEKRRKILEKIDEAVVDSYRKHGCHRWSRHGAYAIILEELDEVWEAIKADSGYKDLESELIHVALVCVRYLETETEFLK